MSELVSEDADELTAEELLGAGAEVWKRRALDAERELAALVEAAAWYLEQRAMWVAADGKPADGQANALRAAHDDLSELIDGHPVRDADAARHARLLKWRARRAAEQAAKEAVCDRPMGCANCGVAVALVGDPVPSRGALCGRCSARGEP